MKKLVIALAMVAGASGAALAQSSALDFETAKPAATAIDYTATASIDGEAKAVKQVEVRDRLGDGSPQFRVVAE